MSTNSTNSSALLARLASLRESTDTSITDKESTSIATPLETYIRIYNKAYGNREGEGSCYTNYMEGAKLLYKFLSPIEIPVLDIAEIKIPQVFHGYEVLRVTDILSGDMRYDNPQYEYIKSLVVYYTAKHILEATQVAIEGSNN